MVAEQRLCILQLARDVELELCYNRVSVYRNQDRNAQYDLVPVMTITFLGLSLSAMPAAATLVLTLLPNGPVCPVTRRLRKSDRVADGSVATAALRNPRAGAHMRTNGAAMNRRGRGLGQDGGIDA